MTTTRIIRPIAAQATMMINMVMSMPPSSSMVSMSSSVLEPDPVPELEDELELDPELDPELELDELELEPESVPEVSVGLSS